ncbi:NlpC/P60 family protein [Streptomyces sp. NPDC029554]|uniref:C40 family peptidase n=1 Tax=Streptomyces sp. NPDC029554 TaxID=3155126 RepID=UPI0033E77F92
MASERTSRPELADMEPPSPDEVRRYVDSLYDRAESDTGTFNATRAAAIPRQRGTARGRSQEDAEPALGTMARQWFDAARAKLGPTVPVSQPDRRPPARPDRAPQPARPARPVEARPEPLALEAPKAPTGVLPELPAEAAPAPTTGSLPQLPEQRLSSAVLGETRRDEGEWSVGPLPGPSRDDAAAWPVYEPAPASAPETGALPAAFPGGQSAGVLATAPDLAPAAYLADFPVNGAALYADTPATGATSPYATALPEAPSAYLTTGSPADVLTATYGAGLPDVSAAVLDAPAPTVLTAPAVGPVPAAPTVPAGSWPAPEPGHRTQAERVLAFARAQIGRPCVWGAVGPGSYDAPGLAQAAWKAAGVTLPRSVEAQWGAGTQVPLAEVRAGDLVFFHDDLGHVGIWSGDGMMIHAPGPGALIREESVFFAGQSAIRGAVHPA